MKSYGASAVILMDSSGHFIPTDVRDPVDAIRNDLDFDVGFHAHNNLGVGVSNASIAVERGAMLVDGALMGLRAGAGNAQLAAIVATSVKSSHPLSLIVDFLEMSRLVGNAYSGNLPRTTSSSNESGLAGVFSGYATQVKQLSQELGIDVSALWQEMGKRKLVAGQESMIREIA
jgi:4-hydroxy 2-oxovalerate aldolase